jgi:hypothetical protein
VPAACAVAAIAALTFAALSCARGAFANDPTPPRFLNVPVPPGVTLPPFEPVVLELILEILFL